MLRMLLIIQFTLLVAACDAEKVVNKSNQKLVFSNINSNYKITDRNNYQCKNIDEKVIKHILQEGVVVTNRDIHDSYSTSGCTVQGTLNSNNKSKSFSFDYGGYINIGNNLIIACAKECCSNDFKYCTWEPNGLK
ncbi:MAG: hypothetical protein QM484_04580 [Woeseiaceae bacterium]